MNVTIIIDDYNNIITINDSKHRFTSKNLEKVILEKLENLVPKNADINELSVRSISGVAIIDYSFLLSTFKKYTEITHLKLDSYVKFTLAKIPNKINTIQITLMTDTNYTELISLTYLHMIIFENMDDQITYSTLSNNKFYYYILRSNILYIQFLVTLSSTLHDLVCNNFGPFDGIKYVRKKVVVC